MKPDRMHHLRSARHAIGGKGYDEKRPAFCAFSEVEISSCCFEIGFCLAESPNGVKLTMMSAQIVTTCRPLSLSLAETNIKTSGTAQRQDGSQLVELFISQRPFHQTSAQFVFLRDNMPTAQLACDLYVLISTHRYLQCYKRADQVAILISRSKGCEKAIGAFIEKHRPLGTTKLSRHSPLGQCQFNIIGGDVLQRCHFDFQKRDFLAPVLVRLLTN